MNDFKSEIRRLASAISRVSKDVTLQDAAKALEAVTDRMIEEDKRKHEKLQEEAERQDAKLHADMKEVIEEAERKIEQIAKRASRR